MTITDPHTETAAAALGENTSHAILLTAAASCEDDALEALECARELGNPDAIARCTAERDLFNRLATTLRANAAPALLPGRSR